MDKFEGVGNGPLDIPENTPYKIIPNYIGAFDKQLPDDYFDLVFSISVLEHINEDQSVLLNIIKDIERVLKPGGLSVHCIDCRFPPGQTPNFDRRKMAKFIIEYYGYESSYVINNYDSPEVFTMSAKAYDRFWKKACNNRSHELDGLPFNIFIAKKI